MKKKIIITTVCVVALVLVVGLAVWSLVSIRREFQHEVFRGDQAIKFISSHSTLSRQWEECNLEKNESRLVRVIAAQGVLQSGSRFCASVRLAPGELDQVTAKYIARDESRLLDSVLQLDVPGRQFQVSPRVGHDGPEIIFAVPENETDILLYYAYAGDGG